ncbi:MAG: flagellar export protein FliJ [Paraglaciecola sp.]|uniref:flagellar export protein FliJ n=1 Tax=Pseudomonadati TaxID=3379134 RepID=UPI002740172E|nr:flagellar export protein FliJ [Paraglaciecola sp.]MDP5031721.1 flagellar export protein FliJ [Paraglaciecola sp.]MDP5132219.1 flagellar export protein FliJ [Paraglaciecola sp.]
MSIAQLEMVAELESNKEQKCLRDFQLAQQHVQNNKHKLTGLEQYRLDYLRQAQAKAKQGMAATSYGQHQQFIGKLDKACEQQTKVVSNALLVAEQRRQQWLNQQKKRKAVEMLLAKQRKAIDFKMAKQEQHMLDELALQRFVRKEPSYKF